LHQEMAWGREICILGGGEVGVYCGGYQQWLLAQRLVGASEGRVSVSTCLPHIL